MRGASGDGGALRGLATRSVANALRAAELLRIEFNAVVVAFGIGRHAEAPQRDAVLERRISYERELGVRSGELGVCLRVNLVRDREAFECGDEALGKLAHSQASSMSEAASFR